MDILLNDNCFNNFFNSKLDNIKFSRPETKQYIIGIYKTFLKNHCDLSKESIILKYAEAKKAYDFNKFQNIGDWVFFIRSTFPEHMTMSPECYNAIAQNSYYKCYLMLNKQWLLYEELADNFPYFVNNIR